MSDPWNGCIYPHLVSETCPGCDRSRMTEFVSHLAGPVVDFQTEQGTVVRQRCQWCGAVLVDCATWLAAVYPPPRPGEAFVATWEVGRFVDVAEPDQRGGMSTLNDWTAGPVPQTACMRMPLEVTG